MKWSKLVSIAFAGSALMLGGTQLSAETLKEAVSNILQDNPEVKSAAYNRLARDEQVRQARAGYLPTLDAEAAYGVQDIQEPEDDTLYPKTYKISLRQNIFRGLATMGEVERQKSRVESQAYVLRAAADHTALRTAEVYIKVLQAQAFLQLAEENLQTHLRIADQIKLRSDAGVSSTADSDQVSGRVALAQANVVVAQTNLADAKSNYLAVVGHLPENLEEPAVPDQLPPTLADAEAIAVENHPTLKSANADLIARNKQNKVAEAAYYPVVDLEVDQSWEEDYDSEGRDDSLTALIRFRFNLFNGINDEARRVETVHLIDEAREIRNNTQRQVVESIRLSWMAHEAVQQRLNYLQARVNSTQSTAGAYDKQFNLGKRTLLDVLDTEAEVIDAKKSMVEANYAGLLAKYRILNGIGEFVPTLGLEYPEEAMVDSGENNKENEKVGS